jgi:hypothetical protein
LAVKRVHSKKTVYTNHRHVEGASPQGESAAAASMSVPALAAGVDALVAELSAADVETKR